MQTLAALRLMVSHYTNGLEGMAVELGKSPKTLRKELSGTSASHKLSVVTAGMISAACINLKTPHCREYINAVASEAGCRVELVLEEDDDEGQTPCERFSTLIRETSDVAISWTEGMADNHLNDNEMAKLEKDMREAERAIQQIRKCARSIHTAGKRVPSKAAA